MASKRPDKRPSSSISSPANAATSADIQPYEVTWNPDGIERRPATAAPIPYAWVPLCGNMTGDLWHCAAATILWEYRHTAGKAPTFPTWRPDTALIVWGYDKNAANGDQNTSITRGSGTYEYMRAIGIAPTLVAMRKGKGSSDNFSLGDKLRSSGVNAYRVAQHQRDDDFWTRLRTVALDLFKISGYSDQIQGPILDPHMFPLWASTAVVMQLIDNIGTTNALKILGHRFSLNMTGPMIRAANERVRKLLVTIEQVKREQGVSKVLIFVYRIGDLNGAHDSNGNLLGFVRDLARRKDIGVIIIPQMPSTKFEDYVPDFASSGSSSSSASTATTARTRPKNDDLDEDSGDEHHNEVGVTVGEAISSEGQPSTPSTDSFPSRKKPKKDSADAQKNYYFDIFGDLEGSNAPQGKQIVAYIWSLIARTIQNGSELADDVGFSGSDRQRDLIGVIGGRSGSLDLASFAGVHCMSWTEPLFKAVSSKSPGGSNYSSSFFTQQGPQICRLLNQAPIMRVCYLDAGSRDPELGRNHYSRLDADALLTGWLDRKGVTPQTEVEILKLIPADVPAQHAVSFSRSLTLVL